MSRLKSIRFSSPQTIFWPQTNEQSIARIALSGFITGIYLSLIAPIRDANFLRIGIPIFIQSIVIEVLSGKALVVQSSPDGPVRFG